MDRVGLKESSLVYNIDNGSFFFQPPLFYSHPLHKIPKISSPLRLLPPHFPSPSLLHSLTVSFPPSASHSLTLCSSLYFLRRTRSSIFCFHCWHLFYFILHYLTETKILWLIIYYITLIFIIHFEILKFWYIVSENSSFTSL